MAGVIDNTSKGGLFSSNSDDLSTTSVDPNNASDSEESGVVDEIIPGGQFFVNDDLSTTTLNPLSVSNAFGSGFVGDSQNGGMFYGNAEALTGSVISATYGVALRDLSDVALTPLSDREVLQYDTATGTWTNGLFTTNTSDLTDFDINSPANNELLTYNSSTEAWENTTLETVLADNNIDINEVVAQTNSAPLYIQDNQPTYEKAYLWVETNVNSDGDFSFWFCEVD